MQLPKGEPLTELVFRDIISLTGLFDCMKMGKVFSQDTKDKEEAITGIRNDNVWENSVSMLTAVAEYTHDTEVVLDWVTMAKVNDISAIVVMDMARVLCITDWTSFKLRYELSHV